MKSKHTLLNTDFFQLGHGSLIDLQGIGDGHIQDLGDLFIFVAMDMMQHENMTVCRRQLRNALTEPSGTGVGSLCGWNEFPQTDIDGALSLPVDNGREQMVRLYPRWGSWYTVDLDELSV